MLLAGVAWALLSCAGITAAASGAIPDAAGSSYNESLTLRPLPRNTLLATFQFSAQSLAGAIDFDHADASHFAYFPRLLAPVISATNTRELHLRFTQGWWDAQLWGRLPDDGIHSGGTGVEMWAVIEAADLHDAKKQWYLLSKVLSGFFCASLNFIDDAITTVPRLQTQTASAGYAAGAQNALFLLRAALPAEPICTENLTPFLKLLPTRGKAGIASLLDGHKLYDSLWHSMAVDVTTVCETSEKCHLQMDQAIHLVVDIQRSLRRKTGGGIPKPVPGDDLRCDESKPHDAWQCFPLNAPLEASWDLESIFGRKIAGPAFADNKHASAVHLQVDSDHWTVNVAKTHGDTYESRTLDPRAPYFVTEDARFDFEFRSQNSSNTLPIQEPPLAVSRSLTGYSQDKGGFRVSFANPLAEKPVEFVYFESLPWYMRLYFHTMTSEGLGHIKNRYYKPAVDRKRPSHLEFQIVIPPSGSLVLTYQFDKSLLLYSEYPPDANHGFAIEPAVISILGEDDRSSTYQLRTTSLLLSLPTPDFSMPYNVIILSCTVMSLAFGSVFNLLTKKVITEEEFEKLAANGKWAQIVARLRLRVAFLKRGRGAESAK